MMDDMQPFIPTLTTPTVDNSPFLTKLNGYCVLFTSPSNPDLMNEYFDHNTDFGDWLSPDINYTELDFKIHFGSHDRPDIKGIPIIDGFATVGTMSYLEKDLFGIQCQCILDPELDRDLWFGLTHMISEYKAFNFATKASKAEYDPPTDGVRRINTWHIDSVFISNSSVHPQSYTKAELAGQI